MVESGCHWYDEGIWFISVNSHQLMAIGLPISVDSEYLASVDRELLRLNHQPRVSPQP